MIRTQLALMAAGAAIAAGLTSCSTLNHHTQTGCIVLDKQVLYRTVDGTSHRTKRLDTTCGSFNVDDSIAGGWSSWERWGQIRPGHTYDITTGGYRLPGHFPTVIGIREVNR